MLALHSRSSTRTGVCMCLQWRASLALLAGDDDATEWMHESEVDVLPCQNSVILEYSLIDRHACHSTISSGGSQLKTPT